MRRVNHRQQHAIDAAKAAKTAPPLNAHMTSIVINALGELKPEQHAAYLALMVEQGRLTQAQADYVARVQARVGL